MAKGCPPMAAGARRLLPGIRLDAGSKAALGNPVLNKYVEKGVVIKADDAQPSTGDEEKGVVIKADGVEPLSGEEVEEAISKEKDRGGGHRMPEIHVDYYGPRGHNARHH
uniref:Uncharacterized protein n=1 Tax=Aegilops tauschii TaxID=37682 RepID=M8B3N5_AEGTA